MIEEITQENQEEPITFTVAGLLTGMKVSIPIAISIFAYGLVFGVLAKQVGLSLLESVLMSGIVFAGSSQFAALGLWATPLPIGTIIITTFIINLRHVLMGAALRPWFSQIPVLPRYISMFFMNDESWALTMGQYARGKRNAAFLLGSGLLTFVAWTSTAAVGYLLGSTLQDPSRWGLDFAYTAVLIALLLGLWRSGSKKLIKVVPWVIAALVAVVCSKLLPDKWYILMGGLAGSLAGAWIDGD